MRHILPKLTNLAFWLLLAAAAAVSVALLWQDGAPRGASVAGAPPPAAKKADANPLELVQNAIVNCRRLESIDARLRHTVNLFGQQMRGSGSYLQSADYQESSRYVLSRLELKLQIYDRAVAWQQVCDGEYLWTYSKMLDDDASYERRLTQVAVDEVLRAKAGAGFAPPQDFGFQSLSVGGLADVLASLANSFEFTEAYHDKLSDGADVWMLKGRWPRPTLASLLPRQKNAIEQGRGVDYSELPPQIPAEVRLYLGKTDLFPYVIVYDRPGSKPDEPMVMMEFFNVRRNQPIDRQRFIYKPGSNRVHDETQKYLQARGLKAPETR